MSKPKTRKRDRNGGNLGFEGKLWAAADKLRGNMDAEHKLVGRFCTHHSVSCEGRLHPR